MFLALLSQLIKNPTFRVGQNWVSNSWEIADIEFVVVGGVGVKSFSCQTQVLSWVGVVTIKVLKEICDKKKLTWSNEWYFLAKAEYISCDLKFWAIVVNQCCKQELWKSIVNIIVNNSWAKQFFLQEWLAKIVNERSDQNLKVVNKELWTRIVNKCCEQK